MVDWLTGCRPRSGDFRSPPPVFFTSVSQRNFRRPLFLSLSFSPAVVGFTLRRRREQELSKRIATAARAPIVVGDVFQDEAAGELQLRYMASLDGAPLDKAARTHEKLRTLSELLAPFSCPETEETVSQLTIEVGRGE